MKRKKMVLLSFGETSIYLFFLFLVKWLVVNDVESRTDEGEHKRDHYRDRKVMLADGI